MASPFPGELAASKPFRAGISIAQTCSERDLTHPYLLERIALFCVLPHFARFYFRVLHDFTS